TGESGPLLELTYGDTATVRVTNMGRKRRKNREDVGYWLDTITGKWLSEKQVSETTPDDEALEDLKDDQVRHTVSPDVRDGRNILVTRLPKQVGEDAALSLMFALERGIETAFQLEDSELGSELLPDSDERARALFIESAEG